MDSSEIIGFAFIATKVLLEIFLIGFSEYIFARNGTLNKSTLKISLDVIESFIFLSLSVVNINLLTPALLFSKITETLDPTLLIELWNEPVFYFIYGGFSLLWSRVGSRILRLDDDYARLCDVATFFANTNTLPVSLIKSIALSAGSQFLLKDSTDTPIKVAARGVSYAMIFATLNNILRWSFGVALMGGLAPKNKSAYNSVNPSPKLSPSRPSAGNMLHAGGLEQENGRNNGDTNTVFTPLNPAAVSPGTAESETSGIRLFWNRAKACTTTPVYAIIAAFIVILIEPLHNAMLDPNSFMYTLWSAIDMCGDACVPLILISLGGQLGLMAREKREEKTTANATTVSGRLTECSTRASSSAELNRLDTRTYEDPQPPVPSITLRMPTGSGVQTPYGTVQTLELNRTPEQTPNKEQNKGIVLVLLGRFVFVPTMAIILITTLRVFFPAFLPIMANDPVYILTLLILSATPPAINLITVSQATGKFEKEAAQILFYGYVLGIFVLAVEVAGFLWLANVLSKL